MWLFHELTVVASTGPPGACARRSALWCGTIGPAIERNAAKPVASDFLLDLILPDEGPPFYILHGKLLRRVSRFKMDGRM